MGETAALASVSSPAPPARACCPDIYQSFVFHRHHWFQALIRELLRVSTSIPKINTKRTTRWYCGEYRRDDHHYLGAAWVRARFRQRRGQLLHLCPLIPLPRLPQWRAVNHTSRTTSFYTLSRARFTSGPWARVQTRTAPSSASEDLHHSCVVHGRIADA
jgi:hypothetical protein